MITESLTSHPYLYFLIPAAFLLGSVPFGLVFTRNAGVDIRTAGSRNIGATNVLRQAGRLPALLTLTGDMLKGAVPVIAAKIIIAKTVPGDQTAEFAAVFETLWTSLTGLAAVLGHMFSVFLGFKGGKGVATGFGVLLVYSPFNALLILLVWISVVAVTKYVSVGGMVAVSVLPVSYLLQGESLIKVLFGVLLALLIIYRHKSNIRNLLAGTESKTGRRG